MFHRIARQGKHIIIAAVLISIFVGFSMSATGATPFNSPQPENQIHQPYVANDTGDPVPQPASVESQGIPVIWIILLILLLFIPATALMATRRR